MLVQLLFYLLLNVGIDTFYFVSIHRVLFQAQKNRISKHIDYAADYELEFKRIVSKIYTYIKCSYLSQTTTIFNSLNQQRFDN